MRGPATRPAQRFGSALNLNIHFHRLVLAGVYHLGAGEPQFRQVPPPTVAELDAVLGQIVTRSARHLERRGLLVCDVENSYLDSAPGVYAADAGAGAGGTLRR